MSNQRATAALDAASEAASARSVAPVSRAMSLDAATTIAATLRALADPLRLRMLSLIDSSPSGELCVQDLATVAEVSLPTVSHHLRVLKDVGLLAAERRGTFVHYRVSDAARPAVAALLEGLAPAALERPTAPDPEIAAGLADADAALDRIATRLAAEFPGLERGDVTHTVRESYTALHRTSRIPRYVVVLAERFARQRLADRVRSVGDANPRPQVLFVCVANAGRSQLAAALLHHYAGDAIEVRSAGSRPAASVHETVGAVLAQIRSGRGEEPFPKPLTDDAVRASDVIVTMGCGDACPILPGKRYQDWVIPDPALASPEGVSAIVAELDERVRQLVSELAPALDLPARPALLPAEPSPNTKENPVTETVTRPSVLFVCVHNAGRSQMAAGFLQQLGGGAVEVRSAGSLPAEQINPSAVEAMLELGIDIRTERPKVLTTEAVRSSDVVITMGCGDACPIFPGKRYEDWKLEDPAGQGIESVRPIRDEIRARVLTLLGELGVEPVDA